MTRAQHEARSGTHVAQRVGRCVSDETLSQALEEPAAAISVTPDVSLNRSSRQRKVALELVAVTLARRAVRA
eukprot:CAMPEP_0196710088 /NCGR_PEP_ID=MMETSP1090-20130531/69496_1 /TAXON_ID=37098 /ORGANISM="Isochrysis sp, Strain CCMP1244" /LENGTH=71 /DNA_ID=CAMNT_0042050109 /DNA_START=38 /DNA_END=250 /DNA_ORIENTATION=-